MNPSTNETSGENLPQPQVEQAPGGAPVESGQAPPEQSRPASPEKASNVVAPGASGQASIPLPAIPAMPMPVPPQQAQPQSRRTPAPTASLQARDDSDLIEKEWVDKAKQIVERTRDDPHRQTEELTLVKVDYMKKRYNKTIKLNK